MSEIAAETSDGTPEIRRLTFDLDVEVCVVGGGIAGLSVALEAARLGASVALLETRRIGWSASGRNLGTVMTGFDVSAQSVVARIGRRAAAELWRMSQTGAEMVRALAADMPDIALSEGALQVASHAAGHRVLQDTMVLGTEFGIDATPWTQAQVRESLNSKYYFGALYHKRAFQIDSRAYLRGLVALARKAGVRIFEETPVTALDVSGTRKRVTTPSALLRATHVVLAGNAHLGDALPRLTATLLPVWRYGAITAPLGDNLADAIAFGGTIADTDGIDRFRVLDGGRLMWTSPETTWEARPQRFAARIGRRMRRVFPRLGPIEIVETFGGAMGCTVHGMPQIGQLRPGLWVASGFGRQGYTTAAMAGRIVAQGILHADDRWRLFGSFDLIWAGGKTGRVAGHLIEWAGRRQAAVGSALARRRESSAAQAKLREARIAAASQRAAPAARVVPTSPSPPPLPDVARDPLPPSPFLEMPGAELGASQQSERQTGAAT